MLEHGHDQAAGLRRLVQAAPLALLAFPLTPEAAAMLVREPGLGRPLAPDTRRHHHHHRHD
ncbi:MAG: hypothetical protein ACXWJJ_09440, partial [Ramlibacter sp.]